MSSNFSTPLPFNMKQILLLIFLLMSINVFSSDDISSWDDVKAFQSGNVQGILPVEFSLRDYDLISLTFGTEKLFFEIDTGAPVSTINSQSVAKIANHVSSQSSDKRFVLLNSIGIGTAKANDFIFYIRDKNIPPWISGTLGLNFLSKFFIQFDTKLQTVVFDSPHTDPLPGLPFIDYEPGFQARIRIPGSLNGRTGGWIVDTGDRGGALQKVFFVNKTTDDGSMRVSPLIGRFETTMTALKEFDTVLGIAREVEIGLDRYLNYRFVGLLIPDEYRDKAFYGLGTVNYFFFKNSKISLAFNNQRITIFRYKPLTDFDFFMSTLKLYGIKFGIRNVKDLNQQTVILLQEGSFLQKAGLQIGDIVLADSGWTEFYDQTLEPLLLNNLFGAENKVYPISFKYLRNGKLFEMKTDYELPFKNF